MKNGSKVSVLMNCYNSELYIKESVQSLIDQTYKDWELIVWDDASIDSTINIIQSFNDNRIKIYKNDAHCGLCLGRIRAQKFLKGEYISILDSDDIYEKDKLKNQIQAFNIDPNLSLVTSWYSKINENGKELKKIKFSKNLSKIKNELFGDNIFAHSSIMYKRSEAEKVGWYSDKLEYSQDYDLTIKLLQNNPFCIVENYLVKIRDSASSMTRKLSLQGLIIKEHLEILNYLKDNFALNSKQKKINKKNIKIVNFKILIYNFQKSPNIQKLFNIFLLLMGRPSLIINLFKNIFIRFKNFITF